MTLTISNRIWDESDWENVNTWNGWRSLMNFEADNANKFGTNGASLTLGPNPGNTWYPYSGSEITSRDVIRATGSVTFNYELADYTPDGQISALFVFQQDPADKREEVDLEWYQNQNIVDFVIHTTRNDGSKISDGRIIWLGFDASEASHEYKFIFTGSSVVLAIDGRAVDEFAARDVGGFWNMSGPKEAVASAWYDEQEDWAGVWKGMTGPSTSYLSSATVSSSVVGPRPINGSDSGNTIQGGSSHDLINGRGGDDVLRGGLGDDRVNGGFNSNDGNDRLFGEDGRDILQGGSGNDKLIGGRGADVLVGGEFARKGEMTSAGNDHFIFLDANHIRGDIIMDFGDNGTLDRINFEALEGQRDPAFTSGPRTDAVWGVQSGQDVLVRLNLSGVVHELRLNDTRLAELTASDFIL